MLKINRRKAFKIMNWWGEKYPIMACEELGELMKALSKVERSDPEKSSRYSCSYEIEDEKLREDLVKELADVAIVVQALACRYQISDDELADAIGDKMDRSYFQVYESVVEK